VNKKESSIVPNQRNNTTQLQSWLIKRELQLNQHPPLLR